MFQILVVSVHIYTRFVMFILKFVDTIYARLLSIMVMTNPHLLEVMAVIKVVE